MRANGPAGPGRPAPTRGSPGNREPSRGGKKHAGITVVLLAAGKGVRMNSRTPKVLHPVAGRPMLLWTLAAARALSPERVLVVTSPGQAGIAAAVNGQGEMVHQERQLGTGHALAQVAPAHRSAGPVVVLYADTPLLREETLRQLIDAHRDAGAAVTVLTAQVQDPTGYGRIIRDRAGRVQEIVEEKDATASQARVQEVNSGVYCFSGRALWPALDRLHNRNRAGEYYLPDVVRLMSGSIETVSAGDPEEILGVNDRRQLAAAEAVMRRRIIERLMASGVTVIDPASTFVDAEVQVGRDTTIHPFSMITGQTRVGEDCVIGPFALLEDVQVARGVRVGPFSRLRPGTVLEEGVRVGTHAEIKNSRIGKGTAVSHFSYIGDTVVGAHVNIGAGTITANWDGFDHQQTSIGDRVQVGSDTVFVAPVTIGDDVTTGAGSVITRNVPAGSLAVERAEEKQIEGWTERTRAKKKARPRRQEVGKP